MERNGDERERGREGGCTSTGNLIMHGRAAGAKKRGKEMDGEGKRRGEDPPTLRNEGRSEGGGGERDERGVQDVGADMTQTPGGMGADGGGGILPCSRVAVGGETQERSSC